MKPTQIGLLLLKLVVAGILLWYVLQKVDLALLMTRFENLQLKWVVAGLVILFGLLLLTGVRWHIVSGVVGASISYRLAIRLTLLGQFLNQVLPSSVGGDGVRAWLLSREGISIRLTLVSVVCDRVAGLVILIIIVAITLPILLLLGVTAIPTAWPLSIGALTIGGLYLLYRWGNTISDWLSTQPMIRPVSVIVRNLRMVLFSQQNGLQIATLSVLAQVLTILSLYLLALSLQIELGMIHLLMFPLIILISSIPISFAGWGLRESAMVVGLGFTSMPASEALALSVTYGLGLLCIGLPGLALAILSNPWKNPSISKIRKS